MNELTVITAIFLLFVICIVLPVLWKWNYSWKGVLIDKIMKEQRGVGIDDSDYTSWGIQRFFLIFKTSEGKIIEKKVGRRRFNEVLIGDKYEKPKRSWRIRKVG